MAKWVEFTNETPSPSGLTNGWQVRTIGGGVILGYVFWRGPWRKYIFAPTANTIYEQDCMRDIADFIEAKTREHREKRKR